MDRESLNASHSSSTAFHHWPITKRTQADSFFFFGGVQLFGPFEPGNGTIPSRSSWRRPPGHRRRSSNR